MINIKPVLNHENAEKNGIMKDGTAAVSDGKIIVTNPDGGLEAKIIIGKDIKLFVDGIEVRERVTVREDSKIAVEIRGKEPERQIETIIDDTGALASIIVHYQDGQKYNLKEQSPKAEIVLNTTPGDKIECPHFSMVEAAEVLKTKGIVYGIIDDNLNTAIAGGTLDPIPIAQKLNPIDASDDTISIKYDTDMNHKLVEINDRVDYYSIGRVVSVNPGDVLVEKIPGSDGSPGIDIYGKPIIQKTGIRIKLSTGKGAAISEDGLRVYSQIVGRPDIKNNAVSVHQVYEVPADVDISTGNIEFLGDVTVKGNVTDGMRVKAGGNVTVYGGITNGHIEAGGDVVVSRNIIGSEIKAGCVDYIRLRLIDYYNNFNKIFMEVFSAVHTLKETGKVPITYKDGQIIKLLMDTKYISLNQSVLEFRSMLADNRYYIDEESIMLGARIIKHFTGNGPLLISQYNELVTFAETLGNHVDALEKQLKSPSRIQVSYVQNSNLSTSGSIQISGKGCYNSYLNCRGDILFQRSGSVMRGGAISTVGNVSIIELGSPGGAVTTVAAGNHSTIICEIAHMGSIIKIGNMSNKLDVPAKKLKAYIYKGELMLEKSKL